MPPSSPSLNVSLWSYNSETWRRTLTASRQTSTPMPSPGRTNTFRFMRSCGRTSLGGCFRLEHLRGRLAADNILYEHNNLFISKSLLVVRHLCELVLVRLQFFSGQGEAEVFRTLLERVAAAVLPKDEPALGNTAGFRRNDFVS